MDIEYWRNVRSWRIELLFFAAIATLVSGALFATALYHVQSKDGGLAAAWFGQRTASIVYHRLARLFGAGLLTLFGVFSRAVLLVGVLSLRADLAERLPTRQSAGTVTSGFAVFRGSSLVVLGGAVYSCSSVLPGALLEEGQVYEITYLAHSREILHAVKQPG